MKCIVVSIAFSVFHRHHFDALMDCCRNERREVPALREPEAVGDEGPVVQREGGVPRRIGREVLLLTY